MKIVQVGGGTAGWMTAFAIMKTLPDVELTVIHNDKPIGVGEATFENLRHYHSWLGINEKEFMRASDASFKFGIWFDDFLDVGEPYCHLFQYGTTRFPYKDIEMWRVEIGKHEPLSGLEWSRYMNPYTKYLENNKVPLGHEIRQNQMFPNKLQKPKLFQGGYGYHMDAVLYQKFLRDKLENINIVKENVTEVKVGDKGIEYIKTENGTFEADLFIDCSGFKQLLIGEFDEPHNPRWIDFTDELPNNRAVVARINYYDERIQMHPYTKATAMDAGWMWSIPLFSRMSHGYVYSDQYTTPEIAEDELRNKLAWTDNVNHVEFKTGYRSKSWIKNCVALGLSSLFIEPLESTGIAIFVRQISDMVQILEKGFVKQLDRDIWDMSNKDDADNIKNFIIHHFLHTKREDTEYWKDWKYNRSLDSLGIETYKYLRNSFTLPCSCKSSSPFFSPLAFDHILSSAGATIQQNKQGIKFKSQPDFPDQMNFHPRQTEIEGKMKDYTDFNAWKEARDEDEKLKVETAPNHYEYIKRIIHG